MRIYSGEGITAKQINKFIKSVFRKPKAGEYYLSGARPIAYKTKYDMDSEYWIMIPYEKSSIEVAVKGLTYKMSDTITKAIAGTALSKQEVLLAIDNLRKQVAAL